MKYYYDLHIHSSINACADVLMSPNNIFNMANLKGLNIISITDHNTTKHMPIYKELSESYDMLFIPGVELSVLEGFHVLCYFKNIDDAIDFEHILENYREKIIYDQKRYGEQHISNIHDEVIGHIDYLLSYPLKIGIKKVIEILKPYEHILIYAHIDRERQSGLEYIHHIELDGVELTKNVSLDFILKHHLSNMKIFYNSDAHQILDILEKTDKNQIVLDEFTIDAFFKGIKHG